MWMHTIEDRAGQYISIIRTGGLNMHIRIWMMNDGWLLRCHPMLQKLGGRPLYHSYALLQRWMLMILYCRYHLEARCNGTPIILKPMNMHLRAPLSRYLFWDNMDNNGEDACTLISSTWGLQKGSWNSISSYEKQFIDFPNITLFI